MFTRGSTSLQAFPILALLAALSFIAPQHARAMHDAVVEVALPTVVECCIQPDGTVIPPSDWPIVSSDQSGDCDIVSVTANNALPEFAYRITDGTTGDTLDLFIDDVDQGGKSALLRSGEKHGLTWDVRPLTMPDKEKIISGALTGAVKVADVSFTISPLRLTGNIKLTGAPFCGETISFEYSDFPKYGLGNFSWRFTYPDGSVKEQKLETLSDWRRSLVLTEEMNGARIDIVATSPNNRYYGEVVSNCLDPVTTGYAVFCEEDGSLEFFQNNLGLPKVGELSNTGKRVSAVYGGVNAREPCGSFSARLWKSIAKKVRTARAVEPITATFLDHGFAI